MMASDCSPLTEEQMKILMVLLIAPENEIQVLYDDILKAGDFISNVVKKRAEAFKLPFDPSAIMMISMMTKGNPGRAVLAMIDSLEEWDKQGKQNTITAGFISQHVYPWGYYTESAFEREWNNRQAKKEESYNYLI